MCYSGYRCYSGYSVIVDIVVIDVIVDIVL